MSFLKRIDNIDDNNNSLIYNVLMNSDKLPFSLIKQIFCHNDLNILESNNHINILKNSLYFLRLNEDKNIEHIFIDFFKDNNYDIIDYETLDLIVLNNYSNLFNLFIENKVFKLDEYCNYLNNLNIKSYLKNEELPFLHYIVKNNFSEMLMILIQSNNLDINLLDNELRSPIFFINNLNTLKILTTNQNIDLSIIDKENNSLLSYIENNQPTLIKEIASITTKYAKKNNDNLQYQLFNLAEIKNKKELSALVKENSSIVNINNKIGNSLLIHSILHKIKYIDKNKTINSANISTIYNAIDMNDLFNEHNGYKDIFICLLALKYDYSSSSAEDQLYKQVIRDIYSKYELYNNKYDTSNDKRGTVEYLSKKEQVNNIINNLMNDYLLSIYNFLQSEKDNMNKIHIINSILKNIYSIYETTKKNNIHLSPSVAHPVDFREREFIGAGFKISSLLKICINELLEKQIVIENDDTIKNMCEYIESYFITDFSKKSNLFPDELTSIIIMIFSVINLENNSQYYYINQVVDKIFIYGKLLSDHCLMDVKLYEEALKSVKNEVFKKFLENNIIKCKLKQQTPETTVPKKTIKHRI